MAQDLVGVFINGCDALLISEWKTDRKIMALAPAKEGKGDIIIVTNSGGKNALFVTSFLAELKITPWLGQVWGPAVSSSGYSVRTWGR